LSLAGVEKLFGAWVERRVLFAHERVAIAMWLWSARLILVTEPGPNLNDDATTTC